MTGQLDLFDGVKLAEPEPTTTVKLGKKTAQIPLRKRRREAIKRLMEILEELEGKDIYIGSYDAGGRHFWLDNLTPQASAGMAPYQAQKRPDLHPQRDCALGKQVSLCQNIHRLPGGRSGTGVPGILSLPVGFPQRLLAKPDR